jgi:DNA gyrase subunit A
MRRTRFLLNKAEDRAENLEAFLLALGHLDDFIRIIRDSKNRDEARVKLKDYTFPVKTAESLGILIRSQPSVQDDRYIFTDRQVNAILELRLYQLTGMEQDKVKVEYDSILEEIKDFIDILAREVRVLTIIKEELLQIREKYATPRRCPILPDEGEIAIEDLIAYDGIIVTLSNKGYIKRTPSAEYRVQARGGKGVRGMETRKTNKTEDEEDDFVEQLFSAQAHDYLMFFTNTGRVYVERVYGIPEGSRASKGRNIKNVLNLTPEENVAATLRLERKTDEEGEDITFGEENGYVLFATRSGKVKKTGLSNFRNFRKDGIIAIKLDEGNTLVEVKLTSGKDDICLITSAGYCVRTSEANIRPMGRPSAGVAGVKPREGDHLVSLAIVSPDSKLLVASENGLGKRTAYEEYMAKGRGGKGMKTMNVTEKTGKVIGALSVTEEDELMLMTSDGQSIRIRCSDVRETGRAAQGVKLVSLKGGEKLQDIARVMPDDEDEIADPEEPVDDAGENVAAPEATTPDDAGDPGEDE